MSGGQVLMNGLDTVQTRLSRPADAVFRPVDLAPEAGASGKGLADDRLQAAVLFVLMTGIIWAF